jgi:hypothetical protein
MFQKLIVGVLAALLLASVESVRADDEAGWRDLSCSRAIQSRLLPVTKLSDGNSGLFKPNRIWSIVVDREERLCPIINTGNDPRPGNRAIAIAKAETADRLCSFLRYVRPL